jgi:alanine dehydrogenase
MSEVAGRMSIQAGAHALEKAQGGSGVLLGGVPGVKPAEVLVIGGGVVGINAARMAMGMNAHVTILDRSLGPPEVPRRGLRRQADHDLFDPRRIEERLPTTDLVIGAVLIPGAAAPKLISRSQLSLMRPGSVLVDVAIDQGGCFETSKATTHQNPTYEVDGIIHYCVANMPAAWRAPPPSRSPTPPCPSRCSWRTRAPRARCSTDKHLLEGLNVHEGKVTYEAVAADLGYDYVPAAEALA